MSCLSFSIFTILLDFQTNSSSVLPFDYRNSVCPQLQEGFKHRVALINRHQGAGLDFAHVAKLLNFEFSEFDPKKFTLYGQSLQEANTLNKLGLGDYFCRCFDIVAVLDTNPDARFLLQRLDQESPQASTCGLKKIIMITTNRFDYIVNNQRQYHQLVKRIQKRNDGIVTWVANNYWEPKYAELKLGGDFLNYKVIRSFGISNIDPKNISELQGVAAMASYSNTRAYTDILKAAQIDVHILKKHYGGPKALSLTKAFIDIPYQASTMKTYENIAQGVITLVPSPRYLQELGRDKKFELSGALSTFEVGIDWWKYVEPYSPELSRFFYQFDSIQELKKILNRNQTDIDWKSVSIEGPIYWKKVRETSEAAWFALFDEV